MSSGNIFDDVARYSSDEDRLAVDPIPGLDKTQLVLEEVAVLLADSTPGEAINIAILRRAPDFSGFFVDAAARFEELFG